MRENENGIYATKSTLKIILDPLKNVLIDGTEQFVKYSWLFQFQFQLNFSEQLLHSSIQEYFLNFPKITLKSRIYVLATMANISRLFEVYRKSIGMELIIAELCKLELKNENEKLEIKNGNQIWTRRKNLTGVHLKVAYRPNNNYLYVVNNVNALKPLLISTF